MKRRIQKSLVYVILMSTLIFGLCGCGKQMEATKTKLKSNEFLAGDMKVNVIPGFEGKVKYGRYMEVVCEIENKGKDFEGNVRVLGSGESGTTMYQKGANIPADEKKKISVMVPMNFEGRNITVQIADKDGEVTGEKTTRVQIASYSEKMYVGVIGEKEKFGYLNNGKSEVFYLEEELPEDYRALDALDVLLINKHSTEALNKKQIEAVCTFVEKGGTLVLGTGANGEKTLSAFSGVLLNGKIGKAENIKSLFGLTQKDLEYVKENAVQSEQENREEEVKKFLVDNLSSITYSNYSYDIEYIADDAMILAEDSEIYRELANKFEEEELKEKLRLELTQEEKDEITNGIHLEEVEKANLDIELEGGKSILSEDDKIFMQKVDYELGNVLVAGFDLGLEKSSWYTLGSILGNKIYTNLSRSKLQQLIGETNGYAMYGAYEWMNALNREYAPKVPNTILYIIILGIYMVLAGPVLYIILKKKDKRQYLWGMIPVLAVTFAVFIYFIGLGTRIQKPQINYASVTSVNLDTELQAAEKTNYFGIMVPDNNNYKIAMDAKSDIFPLTGDYVEYYSYQEEDVDYDVGIEYESDKTSLILENLSAFEKKGFTEKTVEKLEGRMEANIQYDGSKFTGTVTNCTGKDMESCLVYYDGIGIPLGDLKNGESASVENKNVLNIANANRGYNGSVDIYKDITGWSMNRVLHSDASEEDVKKCRQTYALNAYLYDGEYTGTVDTAVIGFAEDTSFEESIDVESQGVSMYTFEIGFSFDDVEGEVISDITSYGVTNGSDSKYDVVNRYAYSNEVTETYMFDEAISLLCYRSLGNGEFASNKSGESFFDGKVYIQNQETREYELIFESGKEADFEVTEAYRTRENEIVLRYEMNPNSPEGLVLPLLRAVIEE